MWQFFLPFYSPVIIYYVYYLPLFVYLPVDGHMSCLLFLTIMNNAFVNIYVQVFVWIYVFISLEYILRYEIAGSYDVIWFNFWGNCQTFSKWLCYFVPTSDFSTYSLTLNIIFFILGILVNVKWYVIVVLISIALMTAEPDHLFCMLAICMSLEPNPFPSFQLGCLFIVKLWVIYMY